MGQKRKIPDSVSPEDAALIEKMGHTKRNAVLKAYDLSDHKASIKKLAIMPIKNLRKQNKIAMGEEPADAKRKYHPPTLDPKWFKDKKTNVLDDVMWVYDHLYVKRRDINYKEAPGPGVVVWMDTYFNQKGGKKEFLNILGKIATTSSNMESYDKRNDDGRNLGQLIGELEAQRDNAIDDASDALGVPVLPPRPETPKSESGVSPEDKRTGAA